jgi:hypothetical protein
MFRPAASFTSMIARKNKNVVDVKTAFDPFHWVVRQELSIFNFSGTLRRVFQSI